MTMNETSAGPALTVFYDGACPLCAREIAFYRTRRGGDTIQWVDLTARTSAPDAVVAPGLCQRDALARFHVMMPDGRICSGSTAFLAVWKELPSFRLLGTVLSIPPFPVVLEWVYGLFLNMRPRLKRRVARGA